ncbi:MAG: response regulator [Flavipsychrobacter sp.]
MSNAGKKLLIIDDDARNIFALTAVLRAKGYQILSAPGALEGLEILKNDGNIGIVLIDMMMPEMDGYEAIPRIKAENAGMPVIAVTAQAMVGDKEKCLQAGADNYVSKPIDVDKLTTILQQYLK